MFKPKIFDTLKHYNKQQFTKDILAGIIVGIVALPLAIAFAIASGVPPEKGLYTAVIGGFIISALGGSRVQIGGPTGAFIIIVYGIVQVHGINGLIIATFLAGIMLIIMGIARLGMVIKYIPHPLIIGFTSGIALLIFSSQMKDFFGLKMGNVPAEFLEKWKVFGENYQSANFYAILLGILTISIVSLSPKITRKIPGSLIAIVLSTILVQVLDLPVETIKSKFGDIPSAFPKLVFPDIDYQTIRQLMVPAFTIALLGGIESLLSAVVSDGMIGGNHKSNTELIAQGTANIFSALFGGIPATGAIARTATNVKNGGRTPVAGIVHALVLFLIMLLFGKWAAFIPLSTLAGILIIVAYNMSEWESFFSIFKGPRSDVVIMLTTFILTVIVDLTVAIEIGMVLASFLFMRNMIQISGVNILKKDSKDELSKEEKVDDYKISKEVEVFEISGPLFFGAAFKFKDALKLIEKTPKVMIIRMGKVPIIDATGIVTLKEIIKEFTHNGARVILSEIHSEQVMNELKNNRLYFLVGKKNITTTFEEAVKRSQNMLNELHAN